MVTFGVNLGTALLLGGAIGLERQFGHHPAGLRTNTLVCLGATLFVSIAAAVEVEPVLGVLRMASMVVGGIGFLGGGIVFREGMSVRGMNTAATLWCSAAVGALVGAGLLGEAAFGTLAIILTNFGLRPVARKIEAWSRGSAEIETAYRIRLVCERKQEDTIRQLLAQHIDSQKTLLLQGVSVADSGRDTVLTADVSCPNRADQSMNDLVTKFRADSGASSVGWDRR
jgi:putative Mg2+ transporter-C (MgtC) family protein